MARILQIHARKYLKKQLRQAIKFPAKLANIKLGGLVNQKNSILTYHIIHLTFSVIELLLSIQNFVYIEILILTTLTYYFVIEIFHTQINS